MDKTGNTAGKLAGMLGLAARARKLICGAELVTQSVRSGRARMALVACDAAKNTQKRVFNCCIYYECECREIPLTAAELGHSVGRAGALTTVAVEDAQMAKGIRKVFASSTENDDTDAVSKRSGTQEV